MPDATFITPDLPGTNVTFVSEATVRPPANVAATVAIPIVHDWGPLNEAVLCDSFGEFESQFGDGDTDGRDAVLSAFVGPGIPGEPGAGGVLVYRIGASPVKATLTIPNTAGSPVSAFRADALYYGERGNRISLLLEDDPATAGNDRLSVLFDGVVREKFSYLQTDIVSLAAQVNARSQFISGTSLATGTALNQASDGSLASGDDGATLTSNEWMDALAALEFEPFSILAPFNLTDSAIQASVMAWLQTQEAAMRPVMAVLGGPTAEDTLAEMLARTDDIRDPHVVSLGTGTLHDDFLDKDIPGSKLAPRVAGALAGRGETRALTNCRFSGLSVVGAPAVATDEMVEAKEDGITVLRRISSEDAELAVAWGVTTFNDDSDPVRALNVFSEPRLVRVIDLFIRRMREWGDTKIVGETLVREETRKAVEDHGRGEISSLLERGLIVTSTDPTEQPYFRTVQTGNPDQDTMIPFEFGWKFTPTTNFLVGVGKVR
jgi:hypothetical protein